MLDSQIGFVLKVVVISLLVSVGIKYLGPILAIPAQSPIALGIVLFPSTAIGLFLLWAGRPRSPQ